MNHVVTLKEGQPQRAGALRIWEHFRGALSLRILELDGETTLSNATDDETLYVFEGEGAANGTPIGRDTGIDLPPGQVLHLRGGMTLVSSLCPSTTAQR